MLKTWKVAALLFLSGACALIFQIAWLRAMRSVFGLSTAANAAVLAVFMGGLGLGGLVLGRRADRSKNPIAFYGTLECLVALLAAATPLLIAVARQAYLTVGGTQTFGPIASTLLRILLAALVLGVPTFLMGGTLPAAARAVESEADTRRTRLAVLYGVNTLGAVTGVFLATFFLLEVFGVRTMLYQAASVNFLVGSLALTMRTADEVQETKSRPRATARPILLVAAFVVGFAFFLMELVWYRMLAPLLGGSSYTFGIILAVALMGIGLGGAAYSAFGASRPATFGGFAVTCALEAFFMILPLAMGDSVSTAALLTRSLGALGFLGLAISWIIVTAFVVLPPAFISGFQFPMLVALLGRGKEEVGTDAGAAYAWNTAGAILGSLAGGFGLMPALTAPSCWRLAAIVLAALAGVAALVSLRGSPWRSGLALSTALFAVVLSFSPGPTAAWRHAPIGAGRARIEVLTRNGVRDWQNSIRRSVLWEQDGIESSVALTRSDGDAFLLAGKVDGNARGDAGTQVMGGMLGALLHPHPKHAFVLGLGTGSSAGWLATVSTMERVDVAELEEAVVDVARAAALVNHHALENPKVRLLIGDAREYLETSSQLYDVIFSEPSNPYRAGVSSLFTMEFYEVVRQRLEDGGLFLQFVQGYEVDAPTIKTVLATLAAVFAHVDVWRSKSNDLLLVASQSPIVVDVQRLRARIKEEPFRSALLHAWRAVDVEGVLARFVAKDSFLRASLADVEPNTDDINVVEFAFARTVGNFSGFNVEELLELVKARGEDRPLLSEEVDIGRVARERVSLYVAEDRVPPSPPRGPAVPVDPDEARQRFLVDFARGDLASALTTWRNRPFDPVGPVDLAAIGEVLAEAGDLGAVPAIERLASLEPVEALAIEARLHLRRGDLSDAAHLLEKTFVAYRTDPWPLRLVMRRALELCKEVSYRDKSLRKRLYRAIREPFAVGALEEARRMTAVAIADEQDCPDAFSALEPFVPWQREFLVAREACYRWSGDMRHKQAARDLIEFLANEPLPWPR